MLVEMLEFAPDFDPATPGVLIDVTNIYHDIGGWAAAPSRVDSGYPALASTCLGAATVKLLDGSSRTFAGTGTKLYEGQSLTWVDVSRVGDYSSGQPWRFTQFGNATLAVNGTAKVQQSITSGAFSDISTAPAAELIDAVSGFVMVANTTDATFGDNPDGWWCCALNDQTSWTPSIATQAARGRIIDSPGPLRGLRRLGDDFIFYKDEAMYIARYQGPPIIWAFERIPGEIGAVSNESIVLVGTVHYFVSKEGFYMFDGSFPRQVGAQLNNWFLARVNPSYLDGIKSLHDQARKIIYWLYASNASSTGVIDECVVYNYRTNKWGRANQAVTAAAVALTSTITYDGLGSLYSTYDSIPAIPYDSSFWTSSTGGPGVFGTDNKLYLLSGTPGAAQIITGDLGNDSTLANCSEVVPRYTTQPTTATCDHQGRNRIGDSTLQSSKSGTTLSNGKFDILREARWHRLTLNSTGPMRVRALDLDFKGGGLR
jgi:hypothetical protein